MAARRIRLELEERRAQLVAVALEHFGARAYDEVGMDEIAAAAGISKGLVFHYFASKKDLYAAAIGEATRRLVDAVLASDARLARDIAPVERLRVGLDVYLAYVRGHGRGFVALLRGGVGIDPAVARAVEDTRVTLLERLLQAASPSFALLATDPRVHVALRGWIGMVEAASLDWIDRGGVTQAQLREILVHALLGVIQALL